MMRRVERENTGRLEPGQDLIAAGYAGLSGTIELVRARQGYLRRWFPEEYLDGILRLEDMLLSDQERRLWAKLGATEWEACGSGGILASIWRLSGAYGTGVEFALRRIPIRQETVEICERLDCNPYRLYSRGCVLLTAVNGGRLADGLAERQIPAVVIGKVCTGIAREIINGDGRGYLERPQPDEILKIIPDFGDRV